MQVRKKLIKNKEQLQRYVEKLGGYCYCIATDSQGELITPYLVLFSFDGGSFLSEDVIAEIRVSKNKEYRELCYTKIGKFYCDTDCYPVYNDWIEFPIKNVYLYSKEDHQMLNHFKMLGKWHYID